MISMIRYKVNLTSDTGKHSLLVLATDKDAAKHMVMQAQSCPECTILSIKEAC